VQETPDSADTAYTKSLAKPEPYVHRCNSWRTVGFLNEQLAQGRPDFRALCCRLNLLAARHDDLAIAATLGAAWSIYSEPAQIAALSGYKAMLGGNTSDAEEAFRIAQGLNPSLEVFIPLAMASMPGPSYSDHLRHLHQLLRPRTYLEIGISTGKTLHLAQGHTYAIGVDPCPRLRKPSPANFEIHSVTSDTFFEKVAPTLLTTVAPISLAFIDGLHLFEQALLDFIHVEAYCDPGGVVAIHDTLPIAELPASRVQTSLYWCGDVWKILACLEHYRPDLSIVTLGTFPSGLTLLTGLDPKSSVLRESFDHAVQQFADQPFSDCENRIALVKTTITNDFLVTAHAVEAARQNSIRRREKSC
jgi:hypothetical protein